MRQIEVYDSADELAAEVAAALLDRLAQAQSRGETPQIGLTGGTIADQVHREIAQLTPDSNVDWSQVVCWWGDERFVEAASPDRNARQAREAFLDRVGVDPAKLHEAPSTDQVATAEEAAAAYSSAFHQYGAGRFSVLMLGVGPDGHVASLFPHHPGLAVQDRVATAVHDSPKPPPDRVSLTFPALNRAEQVWFLASGEGKAEAVAAALAESGSIESTPARGVTGHSGTVWHLDQAAASALPR